MNSVRVYRDVAKTHCFVVSGHFRGLQRIVLGSRVHFYCYMNPMKGYLDVLKTRCFVVSREFHGLLRTVLGSRVNF